MREIKFRGKHITTGVWLYGSHYDDCGEEYILPNLPGSATDYEDYQVDPNTVGQLTGLTDKNGKEIYEGDILLSKGYLPDREEKRKVIMAWGIAGWRRFPVGGGVNSFSDWAIDSPGILEVIGNQYDNPEMLKK